MTDQPQTQACSAPPAVCWFEIYVQDMARATAFYEKVLDAKTAPLSVDEPEMLSLIINENQCGALVRMPGCPSGFAGTLIYFATEDCGPVSERVVPAGGAIERPKFSVGPYGFIALVRDTEGNLIGLHSMK